MSPLHVVGFTLILGSLVHAGQTPQKVIFETDMESDIDDAGALGMLHAMADNGECEILAVMHNTSDPYGPGVIDAINTWYGRPDIPIGKYPVDDAYSHTFGGQPEYARTIALDRAYPKDVISRDDVLDAVKLYKEILAKQADHSVIVISVGWLLNLRRLHEDLVGVGLIQRKIRELIVMGGRWNPSGEPHMNLAGRHNEVPVAARAGAYVVEHWPTPVTYLGLEAIVGFAGAALERQPPENPVRRAYEVAIQNSRFHLNWKHHTADQSTVLFALRGAGDVWEIIDEGTPTMFWNGKVWITKWEDTPDSPHRALKKVGSPAALKKACDTIESLMTQAPKRPGSSQRPRSP